MKEHVQRRQVYTTVLDRLREEILSGHLKPGDRLENVSSLARRLGVGQSSVREAVRVLTYMGLLRVKHGGGMFINERVGEGGDPVAGWDRPAQDRVSLWDLMELRLVVEPAAARLAAQRATFEERTDIRRRGEPTSSSLGAPDHALTAIQVADNAFHVAIVRATHNPLLLTMIERVHGQLQAGRFTAPRADQLAESSARFHPQIAHSIMSHDPARAESFSRAHIEDAMWWLEQRASGHARQDLTAQVPDSDQSAEVPYSLAEPSEV